MFRFLIPIAAFLVLVVVLAVGLTKDPGKLPSTFIGKPAPEFELPSLVDPGRSVGSADFAGRVSLFNVWATWCVGCRQEHGFLMQLAESGQVPIYGLNWRDNKAEALRFLQQLGDPYVDSAYDGQNRVGIDWGVYAAPETFLIGSDGTVLYKHLGPLNWSIWERDFVPLLAQQEQSQ